MKFKLLVTFLCCYAACSHSQSKVGTGPLLPWTGGSVTNVSTAAPLTGGPITNSGTISCPTCAIGPGSSTAGDLVVFGTTDGLTMIDGGPPHAGTVTHTPGDLTLDLPVFGNAVADIKTGTKTGNTNELVTWTGATTAARCVHTDASGNLTIAAADCNTGAGTVTHTGNLTLGLPMIGNGTADSAVGTKTGTTTQFATWTGATTAARCVHTDASGNLTIAAADCGAAGGTGTVTNTLGALTANAVMLGNGTNDSKVLTGITTNGNSTLNLGRVGASGSSCLLGSTSGTACLSAAPAQGSPNALYLPLTTGPANGLFSTNGANPQQTSWTLTPNVTSLTATTVSGALTGTVGASSPSTGAFTTMVAQGATVSGPPGIATGTASNTDLAGQLTLSTGTKTYTFVGTYVSAPICVATDVTALNPVQVSITTTVLTINGTGSDVVNYLCIGRN